MKDLIHVWTQTIAMNSNLW
jgi:hypothetical protein